MFTSIRTRSKLLSSSRHQNILQHDTFEQRNGWVLGQTSTIGIIDVWATTSGVYMVDGQNTIFTNMIFSIWFEKYKTYLHACSCRRRQIHDEHEKHKNKPIKQIETNKHKQQANKHQANINTKNKHLCISHYTPFSDDIILCIVVDLELLGLILFLWCRWGGTITPTYLFNTTRLWFEGVFNIVQWKCS
jgi:hypothetical protein